MTPVLPTPVTRQVLFLRADLPLWRRLARLHDPVVYEIVEPYVYTTGIDDRVVRLWLPVGFRSDLASTPRLTWIFGFRPDGLLALPGWYHDFYYRHGFYLAANSARVCQGRGKTFADRMFAQMSAELAGIQAPGRIAQAALAIFGWWAWQRNQRYRDSVADDYARLELHGDYTD